MINQENIEANILNDEIAEFFENLGEKEIQALIEIITETLMEDIKNEGKNRQNNKE